MPVTNAATEEERDAAFTAALAAALRSDPDAMMVGEIRTKSAADLTFRGALSGHNVWTTLHANSAIAILTRLLDIGVEDFKLKDASLMKGLISQRLFKKLCPKCKQPLKNHPENSAYKRVEKILGVEALDKVFIKGEGCDVCKGKGTIGRVGVFEIILPDATLLDLALSRNTDDAIAYWKESLSGKSLRESAIEKMLIGIISVEELERWCGFLDEKEMY
jgi:type II secretory ATPase GspE/PulE/Tfp pilus assembly ATPase PilB-like protein